MGSVRSAWAFVALCLHLLVAGVIAAEPQLSLQDALAAIPSCATTCLQAGIAQSTCSPTDLKCICATAAKADSPITVCIKSTCTVKESLTTKNVTSHMCGVLPTKDGTIIPTFIACVVLAAVAVILRLVARAITRAYFWWDDLCAFIAMAGAAVCTALNIECVNLGMGMDFWFVPSDNATKILQYFYANMLLYTFARFFIRASIIFFYLRVFPVKSDNKMGTILVVTMVINILYNLAFFFAVAFQCQPVSEFWVRWQGLHEGHCGNVNVLAWVAAVTGMVFDFWLLALPFPQLLALNLHWKKKVMGGIMFMVGAVVTIISIIRLKTINEFTRAANPTMDLVGVCVWSAIELALGVICPCLPSFRLLLRRALPTLIGGSSVAQYEMNAMSNMSGNGALNSRKGTHNNITEKNLGTLSPQQKTRGGVTDDDVSSRTTSEIALVDLDAEAQKQRK